MKFRTIAGGLIVFAAAAAQARAGVLQFGDRNLLGTGTYPGDPTAGATVEGLAPGVVTAATGKYAHPYPFKPGPGTFPGTDQIYAEGAAAGTTDGYTASPGTVSGPQVLTMDYGSLVPAGHKIDTLTLGVAVDDVQQAVIHQPFTVKVNGILDAALTDKVNSLDLSGPAVQFITAGISTSALMPSNVLSLTVDRGGPGGDGWAVDFTTVGVTTSPQAVPEPGTLCVVAIGFAGLAVRRRRSRAVG